MEDKIKEALMNYDLYCDCGADECPHYENLKNAIKDLTNFIHKACNQARIDELQALARNHWQKPIPEMSVLDRIKELKELNNEL